MSRIILSVISFIIGIAVMAQEKQFVVYRGGQIVQVIPTSDIVDMKLEIKERETNGHEYVDLGLPSGVLWATCNVGASTPTEYGEYFAWGEIETKTSYTEANCATYNVELDDFSGKAHLDAASANWGGTWRMPTKAEVDELLNANNCTWTWDSTKKGYTVTSNKNGNSIFLPAAGLVKDATATNVGTLGRYWTSTPNGVGANGANYIYFENGKKGTAFDLRPRGRSIRAVTN